MKFKKQHNEENPLLICNVWDVASAKIASQLNFDAIGTSSGAIATMLGYKDGEEISFPELEYIIKRISETVDSPLSVDLESGYSRNVMEIANHIKRLAELGVVGVNIEDSIVDSERVFLDGEDFAGMLLQLIRQLEKDQIDVFLNIRTDAFLLGRPNAVEETINRINLYEKVGVDGIFVPCIEKEADIKRIVAATSLPINVMCMPNLPDFETLKKMGVKRISMGNFVFTKLQEKLEETLSTVISKQSFKSIFA